MARKQGVASHNAHASSGVIRTAAALTSSASSNQYTFTLTIPPAPTAATLVATVPDWHVNDKVVFAQNQMVVTFPRGAQAASVVISSVCSGVVINDAPVTFAGKASLDFASATTLTLQLSMSGMIPRVFGVDRLSVGNVAGSVTLTPVTPFFAGGSLGATIVLGDVSFEGRFGVNWAVPGKNYYYVKLANGLTMDQFFNAFFGHSFALPASVLSTGFLPGTYFSLAESAIYDDFFSPPVSLQEGIRFDGGVNMFGVGPFLLKMTISSQPPTFDVDATVCAFFPYRAFSVLFGWFF